MMAKTMDKPAKSTARLAMEVIGVILIGAFLAGGIAGYLDGRGTTGLIRAVGPPAVLFAATGIAAWIAFRSQVTLSTRKRQYVASFLVATAIGAALGGWSQLSGYPLKGVDFWSDGPLPPATAIGLAAILTLGLGISMVLYHRGVDDHEEKAWLWAGLAGWYAFIFPAPVWWLLARADLVPPVHSIVLLGFSLLINAIVWLWLKFR